MTTKLYHFKPLAAIAAFGLCASAWASLVVSTGPDNTETQNVISGGSCTSHVDAGNPISGCLNQDHDRLVLFTTSTGVLHFVSGGQAEVDGGSPATPELFGDLTIELGPSLTFSKLVLDIDADHHGFVQFSDGINTSAFFALGPGGSNFFTITGGDFPALSFQTFADSAGAVGAAAGIVHDAKQVRIGGIHAPQSPRAAPEPGSLMLAGLALAGLGLIRRKSTG